MHCWVTKRIPRVSIGQPELARKKFPLVKDYPVVHATKKCLVFLCLLAFHHPKVYVLYTHYTKKLHGLLVLSKYVFVISKVKILYVWYYHKINQKYCRMICYCHRLQYFFLLIQISLQYVARPFLSNLFFEKQLFTIIISSMFNNNTIFYEF
jgi:hypothetical protein